MIPESQSQPTFGDAPERQQSRYRLAILDNDQLAYACLKDYLLKHDTPFQLAFHAFNGLSAFDRLIDHPRQPLPDCILLAQPFDDFHVPFVCNRLRVATAGMPIMAMVTSSSPYHAEEPSWPRKPRGLGTRASSARIKHRSINHRAINHRAKRESNRASVTMFLRRPLREMDSLGLCAFAWGSSGPVTSTCARGKSR